MEGHDGTCTEEGKTWCQCGIGTGAWWKVILLRTSSDLLSPHILQQILVPDSQSSTAEEPSSLKEKRDSPKEIAELPKHTKHINQGDRKNNRPEVKTGVIKQIIIIDNCRK